MNKNSKNGLGDINSEDIVEYFEEVQIKEDVTEKSVDDNQNHKTLNVKEIFRPLQIGCRPKNVFPCLRANTQIISGREKLEKELVGYGYNIEDFDIKIMSLFFDRGFTDEYREYDALFMIQKDIINNVDYATLDFQSITLRLCNYNNEMILKTTTEGYADIVIPKCVFIFKDDLDDEDVIIKELQDHKDKERLNGQINSLRDRGNL